MNTHFSLHGKRTFHIREEILGCWLCENWDESKIDGERGGGVRQLIFCSYENTCYADCAG